MIFSLFLIIRNIDFSSRDPKWLIHLVPNLKEVTATREKLNHIGQIEEKITETQKDFINSNINTGFLLDQG